MPTADLFTKSRGIKILYGGTTTTLQSDWTRDGKVRPTHWLTPFSSKDLREEFSFDDHGRPTGAQNH